MIDWQACVLNLRRVTPLGRVAVLAKIDEGTLRRLARGDTREPKFEAGVLLLDLHLTHCADRHGALRNGCAVS